MAVLQGPDDPRGDDDGDRRRSPDRRPAEAFTWTDVCRFARRSRGRILGLALGLAVGLAVMVFGLLWTLFIGLCAAVGYFIGLRLDETQEGLLDFLDRVLPPGRN